jgi:alpha-L-fucosidase
MPGKTREHITKLAEVVSRGGNYLLNIGPMGDGQVVPFEADVLRGIGRWLGVNGEAIYASRPQPFRKLEFGYATVKPGKLYLLVRQWPADGRLALPGLKTKLRSAYFLADPERTPLMVGPQSVTVTKRVETPPLTVIVAEFDGTLEVTPPLIPPSSSGTVVLAASQADTFFNYNGRGYYEKPTVYKQQWSFSVTKPGRYRIEVDPKPSRFVVALDGANTGPISVVRIEQREYHTLVVTVPSPFAKGDRLEPPVRAVTLRPEPEP